MAELKGELDAAVQSDPSMEESRTTIQEWSETSRYETKTVQEATRLLKAIEGPEGGLLPWIMQRW